MVHRKSSALVYLANRPARPFPAPLSMHLFGPHCQGNVRFHFEFSCEIAIFLFQKMYGEFELQGVPEDKLSSQHWQNIEQRMQTEEAACALSGAEAEENG